MTKQKRMVYIYEENLAYYDGLDNKSDFINKALAKARSERPHADPNNIDYVRQKLDEIDQERRAAEEARRPNTQTN